MSGLIKKFSKFVSVYASQLRSAVTIDPVDRSVSKSALTVGLVVTSLALCQRGPGFESSHKLLFLEKLISKGTQKKKES